MIPFIREFEFAYGKPDRLSPLVRRVIANNPGPFTFTGTGTYLVGDSRGVILLDPGPDDPAHAEAVLAAAPGPIRHILVTHTHRDHCAGTRRLATRTGAPVRAFGAHPSPPARAAPALDEGADFTFEPDGILLDGESVTVPGAALKAVHTPGHIGNHLCFALEEERALFTGDHVMGWATTVIAPPDGDMDAYMASLERLRLRDERIYYPTHGAPIEDPLPFVEAVQNHRRARDAAFLAVLASGPASAGEIVPQVYEGLDAALRPAAALNVAAHLDAHVKRGRASKDSAGRYSLA